MVFLLTAGGGGGGDPQIWVQFFNKPVLGTT